MAPARSPHLPPALAPSRSVRLLALAALAAAKMFGDGEENLFWPKTGSYTRPQFVWTPRP